MCPRMVLCYHGRLIWKFQRDMHRMFHDPGLNVQCIVHMTMHNNVFYVFKPKSPTMGTRALKTLLSRKATPRWQYS